MSLQVLSVRELTVAFKVASVWQTAVDLVSFSMTSGETLALVGESGCGKTMTALSLLRLVPEPNGKIQSGDILFGGQNILKLSEKEMRKIRGKEIAMIFQEPMTSLNPVFTVGEQIAEVARTHLHLNRNEAKNYAVEMMEKVKIAAPNDRYYDYPHQLSGGMRQRVMIAMALACKPKILIADEPTTALDVTIQSQILDLILELKSEMNMAVLFISHDLSVISQVADRMAVMYAGVIVELGATRSVLKEPKHPYTQALLRAIPTKNSTRDRLEMISGRVPPMGEVPPYCRFYDRCAKAEARCKEAEPSLRELNPGHEVRCVKA